MDNSILSVRNLTFCFDTDEGTVHAVSDVSFTLGRGEILGIAGESGCGKSVTAKCIARLNPEPPGYFCGGEIIFDGRDILGLNRKELKDFRAGDVGYVFQNPYGSLNPTMRIGRQIEEALLSDKRLTKKQRQDMAKSVLEKVGLSPAGEIYNRYPHELSGGMRQRVVIAMALVKNPRLIICDEPTTALDVTIEADILGLLLRLKTEYGISMIIITHNIGVIARMCDRLLVMYAGSIVESGPVDELFARPAHPYLKDLMQAVIREDMKKDEELSYIPGMPPDLSEDIAGCAYADRCRFACERCRREKPAEVNMSETHTLRCHIYGNADSGK